MHAAAAAAKSRNWLRLVVPRRTYMDVRQRPSHSRMFDRPGHPYAPPPEPESSGPMAAAVLLLLGIYGVVQFRKDTSVVQEEPEQQD